MRANRHKSRRRKMLPHLDEAERGKKMMKRMAQLGMSKEGGKLVGHQMRKTPQFNCLVYSKELQFGGMFFF